MRIKTRIKSGLASGALLTGERVRGYLVLLAAGNLLVLLGAVCRAHGWVLPIEPHYNIEFLSFYAAGKLVDAGRAVAVYAPGMAPAAFIQSAHMPPAHLGMEAALQPGSFYFAFFYPPIFLALCAPLALMSFYPAYFAWVGLSGALLASGVRRLLGHWRFVLPALAYLPIIFNAGIGETAFAASGLVAWAIALIAARPVLAGLLLSGLAAKPQFLLPVGLWLLFTRRWTAIAGLGAGVMALVAGAAWLFGSHIWQIYARVTVPHAAWVFAHGGVSYTLLVTPASAMLLLGAPHGAAVAVQAAFSAFAGFALWRARHASVRIQGAMLAASFPLLLTTMLEYDATIEGLAILLLCREAAETGFLTYEKSAAAALFFTPLATFILRPFHLPLDPLLPALFLGVLLARCATAPAPTIAASAANPSPHRPPDTAQAR